ncbi:MAG TPA: FAD-dependent oxidoreductase [Pyrinomonadaceae bacterium]|jgi:glycine/D-amino acid oxidase-like deaminating enzyme|nr:FAD-dependent oxidoreductase [Pyrinomonadaceae bacterium]
MTPLNRRTFIQSALAATGGLALGSAGRSLAAKDNKRTLLPVKVSRDRLIRTVVGLRPYRPEGFRVETEKLGDKLLVHHYGHGGAGITLSWGSAHLALELARDSRQTNCAVLGCGVIGLSTARLFQRRGGSVTIYAKDLPPETTSNIAGGFWYPTSVYEGNRTTSKFLDQFQLACSTANRAFQLLAGPEYGVRWIDTFELQAGEGSLSPDMPGGTELYPDNHRFEESKKYFGVQTARQFSTMLIEPQTYLNALLRDFYVAGGKVVVREFQNAEEIAQLSEGLIFNCTGLGAKKLVGDPSLTPVRGQLEILLPQPEIDYCYVGELGYMFPRRDGIILGGTFEHDVWSLEPNPDTVTRILDNHAQLMKRMKR